MLCSATPDTSPLVEPKVRPAVDIDALAAIDTDVLEDSFVYVHCYFNNIYKDMLIRIWKTTFLIDLSIGTRSRLLHVENISLAPQWTLIPDGKVYRFLLIFEGLPRGCTSFDLLEDIPQAGGFHVKGISRNRTDVYHIDIL